jgi:hypothetical protein
MQLSKNTWFVLVIFTYLLATLTLLNAPLRWDETEWPAQANAILKRAVPKVLFSESPFIYHPKAWLMRYGADYGLWHPPLYLYSLAVFIGLLGNTIAAVRFFGLFMGLLTLGVVIFTVRHFAQERGWPESLARRAAFISGMIIAVNPFYVHGTLFIDIDNTILMFLVMLYLLLFIFVEKFPTGKNLFLLGLVTFFLFWTKLTTPPLLIISGAFYCILRRRWKLLLKLCGVAVISAVVFLLSWIIYCRVFKIPVSFFFDYTYFGRTSEFLVLNLYKILTATRFNIVMISLPLAALGLLFFIRRVIAWKRRGFFAETQDIFWLMAAVLFFFYSFFWTNFGKYTIIIVPVLAIPIGLSVAGILDRAKKKFSIRFWVIIGLAALLYYWLIVPDIIIGPFRQLCPTNLTMAMADPRVLRYCLASIPIFLAFCMPYFRRRDYGVAGSMAIYLLVILFPANVVQNIAMFHRCMESNILTPSETSGFMDTVRFVNENLLPHDKLLAPKEFAYYLYRGKVIPINREIAYPEEFLPVAIQGPSAPQYAVFFYQPYGVFASSDFYARYKMMRRIGCYSVWERVDR